MNTRVTFSVLCAVLCHGALFGVVGVLSSRAPTAHVAPAPVEVAVIASIPDPVADAAPATMPSAAKPASAPVRPRAVRRPPQIAVREAPTTVTSPAVADVAPPIAPPAAASGSASSSAPAAPPSAHPAQNAGVALTAKPRYRTNPTPEYPIASRRRREEGVVLVSVAVDADGVPSSISLNHSSGYPLLDQAALDAVRRWTFEPARAAGVPVLSLVVVPVRFSLADPR